MIPGKRGNRLQGRCRLADTWITTDQRHAAGYHAAATGVRDRTQKGRSSSAVLLPWRTSESLIAEAGTGLLPLVWRRGWLIASSSVFQAPQPDTVPATLQQPSRTRGRRIPAFAWR